LASPALWLRGKTCLVTGATSGIGRAAALGLAREGARVVLLGRDAARCEATRAEVAAAGGSDAEVSVLIADLAVQADVRRAAAEFLASGRPLHVLLNNAGVMQLGRSETADGIETTFAVNHLAPFLLTNLLLARIQASAPIVNVSDAHRSAARRLTTSARPPTRAWPSTALKLANLLFTRGWRASSKQRVWWNALHPARCAAQASFLPFLTHHRLFRPLFAARRGGAPCGYAAFESRASGRYS
jgi:NAD(P)-dependent dehydrogenase (short-subunit alcohol dehydrogenase family)